MTDCSLLLDTELWLDGEAGDRANAIARHIAVCPECKAHVETMRRLNFAAREAGIRIKAPEGLLARLSDADAARPAPQPEHLSRRHLFAGFAAAASVVAIASVTLRRGQSDDLATAVFGDFATHLDADRHLDLTEDNPQRVMDWFKPKVPFRLPQLASLSELDLIGGRLCWLLDRRIAAFNFDRQGEALGLYVSNASGLTCRHASLPNADEQPVLLTQDGLHGAFWRDGDLAHALVGESTPDVIAQLAAHLHTYSPQDDATNMRTPA